MASKSRNMRADMPTVAAWIDELRAAFGREVIDEAIRKGMAGLPTFHASENGHEVGTPLEQPDPDKVYQIPQQPITQPPAGKPHAHRANKL